MVPVLFRSVMKASDIDGYQILFIRPLSDFLTILKLLRKNMEKLLLLLPENITLKIFWEDSNMVL